jgi:hypothetical protein
MAIVTDRRYGGEDDNAAICAEFLAVLEDPSRGKSPSAKNERSLDERSQMNTATIFSLIDLLNKWLEAQQAAANPRNARSRPTSR